MRRRIKPQVLSEHAASTAMTAMQLGRLEHIARSVPPDHSAVAEPHATAVGLRGRPLFRQWVMVVASAEAIGFVVPAIVGATTTSSPPSVTIPALAAAGLIEGTVLGMGQAYVLRRALADVSMPRWVVATATGAVLAYVLALLPSSLAQTAQWPRTATVAALIGLGALILLTIGGMQWFVLRRHVRRSHRWISITAGAWLGGLAVFLGFSTPLWQEGQSTLTIVGIGIVGGLLMATVSAGLTGLGLARMLAATDRNA